ncbi:hypothetical protein DICPUDRAFT_146789 [Dictyostelium purpureum]|uniref:Uncharacterized protein n=2 Tax=Dictyostelium purpureum TaxID=5786 RepID=F0Z6R8_DICPU|nr:uncharacterized protein DICPUDRAFT_146789 [Dictyostelium purpureum]EGC40410.1 hypothetical protein DICPUDRAFT_146789 [Dictyostelium purpureum]|eukprot:XP_003283161.1 hypothetical protein DICPUDRAFT_146789 [Dictyostelium purpureum]
MSDVDSLTSPTATTVEDKNKNNTINNSNNNSSNNKAILPFDIKFDENLNKNEKINQMLQNIFENLQELKNRMIVNKEKNSEFFKIGNEIIKKSEEKQIQSTIIDNNNSTVKTITENTPTTNNVNIETQIKKYQDEIDSLKERLAIKENTIKDRETEISDLSIQTEQLKKIIFRLEKDKEDLDSSNSETIAAISGLVEKGRLQMKSLQSEKSKSEQYLKQFNEERETNIHIRKENQLLKQRVTEMLFLLQKAAEGEEYYYQTYSNEVYLENQLLRDLLDASQNIKHLNINNNSNNINGNNNNSDENNHSNDTNQNKN